MNPYVAVILIALFVIGWLVVVFMGVSFPIAFLAFSEIMGWITKYILPWVILFLLLKLIKDINKK